MQDYQLTMDRHRRRIKTLKRLRYANLVAYVLTTTHYLNQDESKTYAEVVVSQYSSEWSQVMKDDMDSMYKNETQELNRKPEGKKVVGCNQVFKVKDGIPSVEPKKFKSRLAAKGFTQNERINFLEVFSSIVKHISIRIILSLVAINDIHLEQMDAKTVFQYNKFQEEIVMSQLESFEDPKRSNYVFLLKNSLYDLKKLPRQWYLRVDRHMQKLNFIRCNFNCCVCFRRVNKHDMISLVMYDDDMILACKDMNQIDILKQQLKNELDMKDLGLAKNILGMDLRREKSTRSLFLSQEGYIIKLLDRLYNKRIRQIWDVEQQTSTHPINNTF